MKKLGKLRLLMMLLTLCLVISCQSTMVVKIDKVENFKDDYEWVKELDAPDVEKAKQTIIIARKERDYLLEYIEILQNRIESANGMLIYILDLREKKKESPD